MDPCDVRPSKRKNGIWYFRRSIPPHLRDFVNIGNKREFNYSLGVTKMTTDAWKLHNYHCERSQSILEEAEERWKAARNGGAKNCNGDGPKNVLKRRQLREFSEKEIQLLVEKWLLEQKGNALTKYQTIFSYADAEERNKATSELKWRLARIEKREGFDSETPATKREILEAAGGILERLKRLSDLPVDLAFTNKVRDALVELITYSLEIVQTGKPPNLGAPASEAGFSTHHPAKPKSNSITLDQLIEKFDQRARKREVKPRTLDELALVYGMIRDFIGGETLISDITREQMEELADLYGVLPAHSSRLYKGKSLREAVELATKEGRKPMERATFNKRITFVASIFNFAVNRQLLASSPAKDLKMEKKKHRDGYKVFSGEQLQTIFNSSIYQDFVNEPDARLIPKHPLSPHLFWTPLIALFQGMRMAEILQLRTDDIGHEDGVNCIHVRDTEEGQSLKTETSFRTIPLHPVLEKIGFLGYVANVRKKGGGDLFPDATHGKTYGNRSHNYSKKFNRHLRLIGVKQDRAQCFHSFRHTFADGLRIADVPQEAVRRLGGWTDKSSAETSYGGKLLPYLAIHIPKLTFKGLDLSHLTGEPKHIRQRASLPLRSN